MSASKRTHCHGPKPTHLMKTPKRKGYAGGWTNQTSSMGGSTSWRNFKPVSSGEANRPDWAHSRPADLKKTSSIPKKRPIQTENATYPIRDGTKIIFQNAEDVPKIDSPSNSC